MTNSLRLLNATFIKQTCVVELPMKTIIPQLEKTVNLIKYHTEDFDTKAVSELKDAVAKILDSLDDRKTRGSSQ